MPGIHKNNTISFRPNDWERELIDVKIKLSGLQKRDFFVRACLYANIVVVGTKENVQTIVDTVEDMRDKLIAIAEAIKRQSGPSLYRTEKRRSIWQASIRGKL